MARTASFKPITSLVMLLFLSLFHVSIASAAAVQFRTAIAPRQSPAATPAASLPDSCEDYSRIANISTIALNATLRGAFLRSSSMGTFSAVAILDAESPKLMSLKFNVALNQQCGNLSALAIVETDRNLTAGTVAGMKILDAPGVAPGNLAMPILCVVFMFMMGIPATIA
ncbi:hypothetical protein F4782DRAFT_527931 [Xylaria castorea]|nr:hypothetical protein F4782DRAFT_527931 [Xylaria castorea]